MPLTVKRFALVGVPPTPIKLPLFMHSLRWNSLYHGHGHHDALSAEDVAGLDVIQGEAGPGLNIDEVNPHLHIDEDVDYPDQFTDEVEAEVDLSIDMIKTGRGPHTENSAAGPNHIGDRQHVQNPRGGGTTSGQNLTALPLDTPTK